MRIFAAWIATLALLCNVGIAMAAPQKPAPDKYQTLVARLKQGDKTVDFLEIRRAFADSPEYTAGSDDDLRKAMFSAYHQGDFNQALGISKKILDGYYLDIEAHQIAYLCNRQLHVQAEADFHHEIAHGLISAILHTGNCRTREAACEVISIHEEYVILQILGLNPGSQSLQTQDGHRYDVLDAMDPKAQGDVTLYFNVDKPLGYLEKTLAK
jgi:hypothetical protein